MDYRLSRGILTVNAREGIHFDGHGPLKRGNRFSARVTISDRVRRRLDALLTARRSFRYSRRRFGSRNRLPPRLAKIAPSRNPLRLSSPEGMRRYRIAQSA